MGSAPLPDPSAHHPARCRLLGTATDPTFSMPPWEPLPSCPGTPNGRRTAPACHRPGPGKNWESVPPLNASLAASSSFFASNALLSLAGLPLSRWSPCHLTLPSLSPWPLGRPNVLISSVLPNASWLIFG